MKWLKIGIAVALAIAASFVAHMHVVAQTYYPTVRVEAPEGLTYVLVQDEKSERLECGAANERFLERIKRGCKDCRILVARCTRTLEEALERDVYLARPVKYATVIAPGLRMAVVGPQPLANATCMQIAETAAKQGGTPATCARAASAGHDQTGG
jgi:hypothetical protein